MTIAFDTVRTEFTDDGSWRDIYVLNTTSLDWYRALEAIQRSGLDTHFLIVGDVRALPSDGRAAFPEPGFRDQFLEVRTGGVSLNCHFFGPEEIEFDLDPRQVQAQDALDAIVGFMALLAAACAKPVVLTPENLPTSPIIRVLPDSSAEYIP